MGLRWQGRYVEKTCKIVIFFQNEDVLRAHDLMTLQTETCTDIANRPIRVVVLGTRGIPDVQGGIETHCQHLFPRLAKMGFDVAVFARKGYVGGTKRGYMYDGVHVYPKLCFHKSSLEAVTHTLRCFIAVFRYHPDIVHIHAIGPALFVPLFRLTGAKVVYTHHGQDYARAKWGMFAKIVLRMGERLGTKFANKIIVISHYIQDFLVTTYKTDRTVLIRNGVDIRKDAPIDEMKTLARFGLEPKKFILACGRFVEEKGFHDLIAAYEKLPQDLRDSYKLVIAGRPDHMSEYSRRLVAQAGKAGVVLTDFISGEVLCAVQRNARLFCIPSYHEGLPIALLEALSYNLDVVASDIPANTEVPLPRDCFAKVGDVEDLARTMESRLRNETRQDFAAIIHEYYDWDKIAEQTAEVYKDLIDEKN